MHACRSRPAPAASAPGSWFRKHRKQKEAHARISALSLMGRGFSFHTATGKNINTVGGAARQQGPGRRAQARGKEAESRPRRARSGLPVPTGPCSARWGCTLGPMATAPGYGTPHGRLRKLGRKLSRSEGRRHGRRGKPRGLLGSECEIEGRRPRRVGRPPSPRGSAPLSPSWRPR